ncbi:hypothetical protein BOC57_34835 [Burkholderia pseudomallei]|nr:hypothetical protein BOC57_34835 [Burkholderia pseudomallei]
MLQDLIEDVADYAASREFRKHETAWRDDNLARARALLATQQPEPRDEVKPRLVKRHSDMSVLAVFCSAREASAFEKEIRDRTGASHE